MRALRTVSVVAVLAGLCLASGSAFAAPECVDKKADKEVVLQPPTPADVCLLDSSQCAPSSPIPVPVEISPPVSPQILLPQPPLVLDSRKGSRLPFEDDALAAAGIVRELLRPPRS